MCKKQSQYVFMRLYDKKNNKNECIIWTVGTFYSSVHIFKGMIWHVQQNVVKCLIIPLPRFSYIYWLSHFKWGYIINGNANKAENEKYITYIRHV